MKANSLRELLKTNKPTVSTRMLTTSPAIVEMIGNTGVIDFIELMGEYAAWTLPNLEDFSRAVELFPHMSSMMKVETEPRLFITQRALGSGIQNMLFADIDTAEEAKECLRYVRPILPQDGGMHGCSSRRAYSYILEAGSEKWIQAQREVVVEIMIESARAVENLDEILSVEGIDMAHFGPGDYSLSIGKPYRRGDPEIKKMERQVIEKCMQHNVRYRAIIGDSDGAKTYIEMGVKDFCYSNDLGIIYNACRKTGETLRELLD